MKINFSWLILILCIFGLLCLLGYFTLFSQDEVTSIDSVSKELDLVKQELASTKTLLVEANSKIIALQENSKYDVEQLRRARVDLNSIREVYSDLFTDAATCYYANYCFKYPVDCVDVLGSIWVGYSAQEIYEYESFACDGMSRDWEKYQSYDESLKD